MQKTTARATAERCIPSSILKQYKRLIEEYGTPLYAYDGKTLARGITEIRNAMPPETKIMPAAFSMGAIPGLMRFFTDRGCGIMCNSTTEVELARRAGITPEKIILSASGLPAASIDYLVKNGIYVNLDSMAQIRKFALLGGRECGARVRLAVEPPASARASAMGRHSRIGLEESKVVEVIAEAERLGVEITGLHIYVGTNVLDYNELLRIFDYFLKFYQQMPTRAREKIKFINVGGGFGVDYSGEGREFDFEAYGKEVGQRLEGMNLEVVMEPGRAALANAGALLVSVTDVKSYKEDGMNIVTVDSTSSHFARYHLYGEKHPIFAIGKLDEPLVFNAKIAGCTTLSLDYLGDTELPQVSEGDTIAIAMTGAYGYAMRSQFLNQLWPAVVLIDGDETRLIARRQTVEDMAVLFVPL